MTLEGLDSKTSRRLFAQWMRDIDQVLVSEDTNPVFEAFRRRRAGMSLFSGRKFSPADPAQLAIAGAAILAFILLVWFCGPCGCFIFFGILPMLSSANLRLRNKRLADGRLPGTIGALFPKVGFHHQAVVDLYLTGATGRQILEGIYMEERDRTTRFTMIGRWILAAGALLVYTVIVYFVYEESFAPFGDPLHLLALVAIVWGIWELSLTSWVLDIGQKEEHSVAQILHFWENGGYITHVIQRGMISIVVVGFTVALIVALELLFWVYTPFPKMFSGHIGWLVLINVVLGILGMRLVRKPLARIFGRNLEAQFAKADIAFLYFVATRVADDPDIANWRPQSLYVAPPEVPLPSQSGVNE